MGMAWHMVWHCGHGMKKVWPGGQGIVLLCPDSLGFKVSSLSGLKQAVSKESEQYKGFFLILFCGKMTKKIIVQFKRLFYLLFGC